MVSLEKVHITLKQDTPFFISNLRAGTSHPELADSKDLTKWQKNDERWTSGADWPKAFHMRLVPVWIIVARSTPATGHQRLDIYLQLRDSTEG